MFVKKRPENDRRVPTQERARRRVARILDAAALVFAEQGFEAATMEDIAARAETSIGSIYQFFPNKLAIFDDIARRYRDRARAFFEAILESPLFDRPLGDIVDAAIEALWAFHDAEPAFRAVWVGLGLTQQVLAEGEALNRELAKRIEAVLAKKLHGLSAKHRPVVATMVVELLTAMLIVSARRDAAQSKVIKEETKVVLNRYLAKYEIRSSR